VSNPAELQDRDVGKGCRLFEVKKINDEYYSFITDSISPRACTIILRGPSKEILSEMDRCLQDALHVSKNIYAEPSFVYGGGAAEMAVSLYLEEKSKSVKGVKQLSYRAVSKALEVIPSMLSQNCGANPIKSLAELRAKKFPVFWN